MWKLMARRMMKNLTKEVEGKPAMSLWLLENFEANLADNEDNGKRLAIYRTKRLAIYMTKTLVGDNYGI